MAIREQLEVGNNIIEAEAHDEFADSYSEGYLYYYDTNRQLPHPITTESVYTFIMENLFDQQETIRWNAGFVFGWIAALCENNPTFFYTSIIIPECVSPTKPAPTITLQEA
jgi:hypothetical protein